MMYPMSDHKPLYERTVGLPNFMIIDLFPPGH